jgi:hypothetical protein
VHCFPAFIVHFFLSPKIAYINSMLISLTCHFTLSVHDSWSMATLWKGEIISVQKVMKVTSFWKVAITIL